LLDFGACANAALDNKDCCQREWRHTLQLLEAAGIRSSVLTYLCRLLELETSRPLAGEDSWHVVMSYREAVVRLSLGMVATTARGHQRLDEGIRATYDDADLNLLFRIVMHCQIIDDLLDYDQDLSTGLPSFLTASRSLARAFELTRSAALGYADVRDLPRSDAGFPLRLALLVISACTKLIMLAARWRQRAHLGGDFSTPLANQRA
jgi:hypothetical protein